MLQTVTYRDHQIRAVGILVEELEDGAWAAGEYHGA